MSIKAQHGIALMTVIVFLFIMSLTWLSFSFISSYENDVLQKEVASEQAFYVAEAGVQLALWGLSQHPHWMTDNWWITQFGGTRGTDTDEKGQQYQYYQWTGNLGLLWPGDIRAIDRHYTVRIRDHGLIKDKIVSTGTVETSLRKLETELASAFDYGLYSHKNLEFRSSSFTVSGSNQTGYVYAKDSITGSMIADKITGTYQNAPWFLPKEIPLPELWTTKTVDPQTGNITWVGFEAKINGAPTATTIQYTIDSSEPEKEAYLKKGVLLHNKTRGNFRKISSTVDPDKGTNTITADASPEESDPQKKWAAGDDIVVERIYEPDTNKPPLYENYWTTLNTRLNNLLIAGAAYPPPSSSPPYINQNFTSDTCFTPTTAPFTVQFLGNTTFAANNNIIIDGNAIFGRVDGANGSTVIAGDVLVNGNAYFFNNVSITGHLYVVGLVYMWDQSSYNITCETIPINELSSGSHGISIGNGGGLFVQNGAFTINKNLTDGNLTINDYCYVNGDVTINSIAGEPLVVGITPATQEKALYIRNGSLIVNQDLNGMGKIVVSRDINISGSLLTPASANPLLIAAGGNFIITNNIGSPFYGMVYVGENANIVGSTTMSGGLLVVNGFDPNRPYLSGSSIAYQDYKSLLTGMGFMNNKDFVRPLLWRDTTE